MYNKVMNRRLNGSNDKNLHIFAKTCKRLLAVLHKSSIWVVKDSLSAIVIPSSLISLLDFNLLFSIIYVILLLSMFDPRNIL